MAVVVVPAAVAMVVLARPIVNGLLLYGHFTTQSASRTADALAMFGLGLFAFSVFLFALRCFYAFQDTRTPFFLNSFENGVNIVVALALYPVLEVSGLALSWSVAYGLAAVAALVALRKRLGRVDGSRVARSIVRIAIAAIASGAVSWLAATAVGYGSAPRALAALAAAGFAGLATYVGVLVALRADEVTELRDALRRRRPTEAASAVGR
jgi:putative peptidoglycan lipid II flippase